MPTATRAVSSGEVYRLGSSGRYLLPRLPVSEEDDALLLFMEAIEAVHPRVIEDLKKEVLPAYEASCAALGARHAHGLAAQPDALAEERRYREALLAWQRRYHLERWVDPPADSPDAQPNGSVPPDKTPAGRFQFFVEAVLTLWRDAQAPPKGSAGGGRTNAPPDRIQEIQQLAWESREMARWAQLLRTTLDKDYWTRIQLLQGGPGVAEYRKAIVPPSLPRYNPVESEQTWGEYMAEVHKLLESYRQGVETAIEMVDGRKAAEKFHLEHFQWLAQRQVLGLRPSELKARRRSSDKASASTVRNVLRTTAALIGLDLVAFPPGPKPS